MPSTPAMIRSYRSWYEEQRVRQATELPPNPKGLFWPRKPRAYRSGAGVKLARALIKRMGW